MNDVDILYLGLKKYYNINIPEFYNAEELSRLSQRTVLQTKQEPNYKI